MYAATQWTPLPTGHGPLGLASQKKGQVTPTVRTDTTHFPFSKLKTAYPPKSVDTRFSFAFKHSKLCPRIPSCGHLVGC